MDAQRIRVLINGAEAGEWTATKIALQTQTLIVPANRFTDGVAEIVFELPDAVSPAKLAVGSDERKLAIRVHSLVLSKT